MTKRVEMTERIKALLSAKLDSENPDFSKIAVYECIAASTRKISQRNSPYDGAIMAESVLTQAVDYLQAESVPILTMHEGQMLPIGQVLEAQSLDATEDHKELRVLFYLQSDSDYADKLDLGIIDEVSVGMLAAHAYCSECDFDYMAQGNEMHFYFRECANDHALGIDGTHLRLSGCGSWKELSLVGKGASSRPKIVGRSKQVLSAEKFQQLAASGINPDLMYLLCSASNPEGKPSITKPPKETAMELTQLITELTDEKAAKLALEASVASLTTQLGTSETALTASTAQVLTLTDEIAKLKSSDAVAQLEASTTANVELSGFIKKNWELALKATGQEVPEETPSNADMIASLEASQTILAAIPRNGVSLSADSDEQLRLSTSAQQMAHADSFK